VALALWFFTASDDATTSGPPAAVPGVAAKAPPPHAGDVRRGNVVIVLGDPADEPRAQTLAHEITGAPSEDLRAAGQAVIVEVQQDDPRLRAGGHPAVLAYARDRSFTTSSVADPNLRAFVEYWLGRAAG
jgi:hypothetical protein